MLSTVCEFDTLIDTREALYEVVELPDDPLSDLVEIAGLEPAASGLQSRRSPS